LIELRLWARFLHQMPQDELLDIINQVRENKRQQPYPAVRPETRLREDLGFTSLDLAELTVRIEEKFGVDVFADGLVSTAGEILAKITAGKT
jgi:acyl carrier protein